MAPVIGNQYRESHIMPILDLEAKNDLDSPLIPQSISYGSPSLTYILGSPSKSPRIKRNVSNDVLVSKKEHMSHNLSSKLEMEANSENISKKAPDGLESNPKIANSNFMPSDKSNEEVTSRKETEGFSNPSAQERMPNLLSKSLSGFTKPWDTILRSTSPSNRPTVNESFGDSTLADARPSRSSSQEKNNQNNLIRDRDDSFTTVPSMKSVPGSKFPRRPISAFLKKNSSKPSISSGLAIPKSFPSDKLLSGLYPLSPLVCPTSAPKPFFSDLVSNKGVESPRKKDELWGTFRNLDADFQRLQSRSITSRIGVVRSSLLQFLRTYADHPSNGCLKPDDLDRRINILSRWWMGMLELLNGRNGESVSGNDRAVILEAVTAIMIRPEWDPPTQPSFIDFENKARTVSKSRSTTSLTSNGSDFLAESVFHNIRNTFSQNLLAQMTFVTEKMSERSVAPSVVTFCGKATAYAFFYCDGVAEILVRLWDIQSETLHRILAEYNVHRYMKLQIISEKVVNRYPLCLHTLAFRSLPRTMRYLRSQPQLPIATAYIPWHGPWVRRWEGKETDLFFAFTKIFHNLTCRLLPDGHNQEERISAPGYMLVQAQVLTVLDSNLQHDSNQFSSDRVKGPSLMTFDDILGKPDATAPLLPLPAGSGIRSMAENRLIILLRDCLSRASSVDEKNRRIFAESFENSLKAAARRTSLFDHNACFILCDFMEEAIAILTRYHQTSDPKITDIEWPFWLDVLKRMGKSQNTMTEIRLYAFLYSLWGTITSDETRKSKICLEWLLNEEIFQSQFNHWCPMVRAYFMRLLCWRVARCDGRVTDLDKKILETLFDRLWGVWGVFLYFKELSETCSTMAPSTTPCSPAPGRCLLIVRDDLQATMSGVFLSSNNISSEPSRTQATAYERYSSLSSIPRTDPMVHLNRVNGGEKRRWSTLRSILPFVGSSGDRFQVPSASSSISDGKESQRVSALPHLEQGNYTRTDHNHKSAFKTGPDFVDVVQNRPGRLYNSHSFKFSLECIDKESNPTEGDKSLSPPKLPITAQMLLRPSQTAHSESSTYIPTDGATKLSKYTGRALSEWDLIVNECQKFFERRKIEGVPTNHKVETPALGIEFFKKLV